MSLPATTTVAHFNTRIFERELWLPRPIEEVFKFFADARNLQQITPHWLHFSILTPGEIKMGIGTRIDYRLRLRGIPLRWQTEITAWEPPYRFVDEQKRGPYKLWVHEHRFEAAREGTLATDLVRYAVPGGKLMDWLFVRRDIKLIFEFRRKRLLEIFATR